MLLLVVWIVVGVFVVAVLGSVLFGVLAALRRLGREVQAFQRDIDPVRQQARQSPVSGGLRNPLANEG